MKNAHCFVSPSVAALVAWAVACLPAASCDHSDSVGSLSKGGTGGRLGTGGGTGAVAGGTGGTLGSGGGGGVPDAASDAHPCGLTNLYCPDGYATDAYGCVAGCKVSATGGSGGGKTTASGGAGGGTTVDAHECPPLTDRYCATYTQDVYGCIICADGSGGATGTGGATTVDASAEARAAKMGDPCESQADCGPNPSLLYCLAPGQARDCGLCKNTPNQCATDADCLLDGGASGGTKICDPAPRYLCYCNSVKICIAGCRSNGDCAAGTACDATHTCQQACVTGDGSCPADYTCGSSGTCVRKTCTSDAECSGACVNGSCYSSRGTCEGAVA